MNNNQFLKFLLAGMLGAFIVVAVNRLSPNSEPEYDSIQERQSVRLTNYEPTEVKVPEGLNFVTAAEQVTPGVVHIRSLVKASGNSPFDRLYNGQGQMAQSSGSGVIVSDDGFIVTNNHVVDNAEEIVVVLDDNRQYDAEIIGVDSQTDLALIKIKERNLPFVVYGDSEAVRIGEWVLAVGNPFNLTSTVTAGIVSAKARNIGILADRNNLQIESFIQTDAAVNPGNSGGALVNLKGELVGINTAIATQSGRYEGYSFAVPVSLVKKVVDDLLEFGKVQRGLLGVRIGDMNARLAEMEDINVVTGVYIGSVNENSAAEEAGMKAGDVVLGVDGMEVDNVAELQEQIALKRPGDEVLVKLLRDNKPIELAVVLKSAGFEEAVVEVVAANFEVEGALFENLSEEDKDQYKLNSGAKVVAVDRGKWFAAGIEEGFVVTKVDEYTITSVEDLKAVLLEKKGGILIEGISKEGEEQFFGLKW